MSSAAVKRGHCTYGEYRAWPDDERWELIDGQAFAITPAPTRAHQRVGVELVRQIANFLREHGCEVYAAPFDVRLPRADEGDDDIDTVVQPDICVICDPAKLDAAGCRGAPDWIVEIISPSTAAKDQIRKRALYARHGVEEYWLVHPSDRIVTVYRLQGSEYGRPYLQEMRGRTPVGVIEGLEIDWEAIF